MHSNRAPRLSFQWTEIQQAELDYIFPEQAEREGNADPTLGSDSPGSQKRVGLAISGGGIRSAAFGTGLLQALVSKGVLPKIDYLSTVSGGGYIGACLTYFLHVGNPVLGSDVTEPAGVEPDNFPLGRARAGRKAGGGEANLVLDFLRQHGNYLLPSERMGASTLVAVVLRAMSVSLSIYGGMICAFVGCIHALGLFHKIPGQNLGFGLWRQVAGVVNHAANPLIFGAGALALFFVLLALTYGLLATLRTHVALPKWLGRWLSEDDDEATDEGTPSKDGGARYALRTKAQRVFGILLSVIVTFSLLGLVPVVFEFLRNDLGLGREGVAAAAGGSTLIASVLGFLQSRAQQSESAKSHWLDHVRIYLGANLMIFGLFIGSYALVDVLSLSQTWALLWPGLFIAFVGIGLVINLNSLGLHRMYRDRLMEAFMPDPARILSGTWGAARTADDLLMEEICAGENRRPYHIVNTNAVLINSSIAKHHARGGTNFILSREYCGCPATGWRASSDYMKERGLFSKKPTGGMTLATAMAVSGAAANPNAGVAGRGASRSRPVSMLLSILNIRLGYWAPNPRRLETPRAADFIRPGIKAVFGQGFHQKAARVELSDGGHFENLGLYELIRRRLDLIICSDAGCDPDFAFGDLANAIERVRVDFGVQIDFDDPELSLAALLPGTGRPNVNLALGDKILIAERGYARATIRYPAGEGEETPKKNGVLYFMKTTLTAGLPADLYGYKLEKKDFPDESTADQFFDERQFEAYRELGYQLGDDMLDSTAWKLERI